MIRCSLRLRVRYGETDRMGRAYYACYFDWFTQGRTELIRHLGLPYRQLEDSGLFLPVLEAGCRYLRPVDYDDQLDLTTELRRLTPTRMDFTYQLHNPEGQLVAEGETRHAFLNVEGRPVNVRKARPGIWERLAPWATEPAPSSSQGARGGERR